MPDAQQRTLGDAHQKIVSKRAPECGQRRSQSTLGSVQGAPLNRPNKNGRLHRFANKNITSAESHPANARNINAVDGYRDSYAAEEYIDVLNMSLTQN
jgi:hypothetical protein